MTTPSSRNQRLTKNAAVSFAGFAVRAAITFLVTPILVRGLGDRRYGVWSLVESVLAYLTLFDLGILAALVRHAARFEARHDWDDFNRVVNTSFAVYLGLGGMVLSITLFLALGWAHPLGAPADLAAEIRILLLLLGANLALRLPLTSFASLLDSLGQYPLKAIIQTSWSLVGSLLIVALIRSGHGLPAVGLVLTGCGLGESLTSGLASFAFLPRLRLSWRYVDRATLRMISGYSVYSFLGMIAGRISFQTDALVIGAFLAPQYITFFLIGARLVEFAKEPFRTMSLPFMPAISSFQARSDLEAIRRLYRDGTRILLRMAIPLQVGFALLGRDFIGLWMGPEYPGPSFPVLATLSLTIAPMINQMMAVKVIYGMGDLRFLALTLIVEALANLGLSVALARPMGILGVAIGTTVPNLIANAVAIVWVCRMLDLPVRDYLLGVWLRPALLGVALGAFWLWTNQVLPVTSWGRFLIVGSMGTALYALAASWAEFGFDRMAQWIKLAIVRCAST